MSILFRLFYKVNAIVVPDLFVKTDRDSKINIETNGERESKTMLKKKKLKGSHYQISKNTTRQHKD